MYFLILEFKFVSRKMLRQGMYSCTMSELSKFIPVKSHQEKLRTSLLVV